MGKILRVKLHLTEWYLLPYRNDRAGYEGKVRMFSFLCFTVHNSPYMAGTY